MLCSCFVAHGKANVFREVSVFLQICSRTVLVQLLCQKTVALLFYMLIPRIRKETENLEETYPVFSISINWNFVLYTRMLSDLSAYLQVLCELCTIVKSS